MGQSTQCLGSVVPLAMFLLIFVVMFCLYLCFVKFSSPLSLIYPWPVEPHGGGGIVWFCCFAPSSNALPHSLDLLHWFSHFQEFLSQSFQYFSLLVQRYFSRWFRHFQEFLSQSFHFHSLAPHLLKSFKFFLQLQSLSRFCYVAGHCDEHGLHWSSWTRSWQSW